MAPLRLKCKYTCLKYWRPRFNEKLGLKEYFRSVTQKTNKRSSNFGESRDVVRQCYLNNVFSILLLSSQLVFFNSLFISSFHHSSHFHDPCMIYLLTMYCCFLAACSPHSNKHSFHIERIFNGFEGDYAT